MTLSYCPPRRYITKTCMHRYRIFLSYTYMWSYIIIRTSVKNLYDPGRSVLISLRSLLYRPPYVYTLIILWTLVNTVDSKYSIDCTIANRQLTNGNNTDSTHINTRIKYNYMLICNDKVYHSRRLDSSSKLDIVFLVNRIYSTKFG